MCKLQAARLARELVYVCLFFSFYRSMSGDTQSCESFFLYSSTVSFSPLCLCHNNNFHYARTTTSVLADESKKNKTDFVLYALTYVAGASARYNSYGARCTAHR